MQIKNSLLLLGLALQVSELVLAIPVQDSPRQRLLDGHSLPAKYRKSKTAPPYTPGNKDPYDKAIDAVGEKLDPLPYRNGLGASVLGPWNWERSRQSPDLVRPPSTDHGNMGNMRWSFADSHVRIEVRNALSNIITCKSLIVHRKGDGLGKPLFESWGQVLNLLV
jgi:hypothetical protein